MGFLNRWREWRAAREEYRASVEEMHFHIEQETAHNIRNGMPADEARRAAQRSFGGVDRFAEAAHDERPGTKWSEFRVSYLDWKLGARMLVKHPGVSVLGAITLAVAIGLAAGWFEVTRTVFHPDLPLADGDRIVRVEYTDAATQGPELRTMHEFVQWRERLTTIEQLGAHRTIQRNMVVPGAPPQVVEAAEITAAGFVVPGVPPLLGRPLLAGDEATAAPAVVVIGYDAWQRYFDSDPSVIGSELELGPVRATVVGVMPEGYRFPSNHQFWVPLRPTRAEPLGGPPIEVFGRLRPGATLESADAELSAWAGQMAQLSPATHERLRLRARPFAAPSADGASREVFLINLAAWLILALACANVAALMFARTATRESEIVIRNALGASRARVMGQLFIEAFVLTSAAALVGLLGVKLAMTVALDRLGDRLPFWWDADIEPATILYTAGLALAGAAMVALLPALRATGPQVRAGMAQIGAGNTRMRFGGAWSALIVMQVASSVICLPFGIGAAAEAYQEYRLRAAFPADGLLTFRPVLDSLSLANSAEPDETIAQLSSRLREEPDVAGAGITAVLPGRSHPLRRIEMQRASEPPVLIDANTEGDRVRIGQVGPGFFETIGVPLLAGREFRSSDASGSAPVVVINESLARNIGGNPLGVRVRFAADDGGEAGRWHEVVGVARNLGLTPTGEGEADYLYVPASGEEAEFVMLRVHGNATAFEPRLRALAFEVDPALRLMDVQPLREVIREEYLPVIQGVLAGNGIVLLIIILSAASLYALMSVSVALRTREIGVRLAIGASPRAVLLALFRRAATQVGIGLVAGNIVVAALLYMMADEVRPGVVLPPLGVATVAMLLVGLGACLLPARRALRVQPTEALKAAR